MFKSAHHALQFAYRVFNSPIVKTSSFNAGGVMSGHGELTPHDKHAQAAMILSIVERSVDVNGQAYLKAHYGREFQGGENHRAVMDVLFRVAAATFPSGLHRRRGVESLIATYFGKGYSMISIRKDLGCNNRRYYEYKEWVNSALDDVGRHAEDDACRALEGAGLIEEEAVA